MEYCSRPNPGTLSLIHLKLVMGLTKCVTSCGMIPIKFVSGGHINLIHWWWHENHHEEGGHILLSWQRRFPSNRTI